MKDGTDASLLKLRRLLSFFGVCKHGRAEDTNAGKTQGKEKHRRQCEPKDSHLIRPGIFFPIYLLLQAS